MTKICRFCGMGIIHGGPCHCHDIPTMYIVRIPHVWKSLLSMSFSKLEQLGANHPNPFAPGAVLPDIWKHPPAKSIDDPNPYIGDRRYAPDAVKVINGVEENACLDVGVELHRAHIYNGPYVLTGNCEETCLNFGSPIYFPFAYECTDGCGGPVIIRFQLMADLTKVNHSV